MEFPEVGDGRAINYGSRIQGHRNHDSKGQGSSDDVVGTRSSGNFPMKIFTDDLDASFIARNLIAHI